MLGEEEAAEGADPRQNAGDGGNDAELDQQRDEDEPVGHPSTVARGGAAAQTQNVGGSVICDGMGGKASRCGQGGAGWAQGST